MLTIDIAISFEAIPLNFECIFNKSISIFQSHQAPLVKKYEKVDN